MPPKPHDPPETVFSEAHILTAVPFPMLLVGSDQSISFANEAAEAFFGRSKRRIMQDKAANLLYFASDRLNNAILAGESDISAQNMRLLTPGAQANYVDISISSLVGHNDKRLMTQVRKSSPEVLATTAFSFKDARLIELLFRYRARNFPASLSPAEQLRWREFCRWRLDDPASGCSLTLTELHQRVAHLRADVGLDERQERLMQELLLYVGQLP